MNMNGKCSSAVTKLEAGLVVIVIILAIVAGVGYWQASTVAPATTTVATTVIRTQTVTQTSTVTQTTTLAPGAT
ncbi:MAG: hypothetical protein QXK20_04375, partial [Nitrososphaerales archaeon]